VGRLTNPSPGRRAAPAEKAGGRVAAARPRGPQPNPRRPNKRFLAITALVLLAWVGFLVVMAWLVRA